MKDNDIRMEIAKACGTYDRWVIMKRGLYYRPNANGYTSQIAEAWIVAESEADQHTSPHVYPHGESVIKHRAPLPDYLNDLNAMNEAEKVLGQKSHLYADELRRVLGFYSHSYFDLTHATARQRAESFLRTINKWVD